MENKADIWNEIRKCQEIISAGLPKLEHRDCPPDLLKSRCLLGSCKKIDGFQTFIYNNTLDAAHRKLGLIRKLGKDFNSGIPGALMEVYKLSLYTFCAKVYRSGIYWNYGDPRELKLEALQLVSTMSEPFKAKYREEANKLKILETLFEQL
jgi:hypothetical protein